MALSEARKKANNKWDKENMCVVGCKVKREQADQIRQHAANLGESVNAYIKRLIDQDMKHAPGE